MFYDYSALIAMTGAMSAAAEAAEGAKRAVDVNDLYGKALLQNVAAVQMQHGDAAGRQGMTATEYEATIRSQKLEIDRMAKEARKAAAPMSPPYADHRAAYGTLTLTPAPVIYGTSTSTISRALDLTGHDFHKVKAYMQQARLVGQDDWARLSSKLREAYVQQTRAANGQALYQRIVGEDDWIRLPPKIRALYDVASVIA